MKNRNLYLITYDIQQPKRRRAVLKAASSFATGGQKSVYECWLTDMECGDLLATLSMIIDENVDSLICIRPDPRQQVITLGRALSPNDGSCFYVG